MLSYRHAYHAGNHADVLKHLVVVRCVRYLRRKDRPLCYVDTHAAAGGYSLLADESQKCCEYQSGIEKLWQQNDLPESVADYRNLVAEYNQHQHLSRYPGSPWLAAKVLSKQDALWLHELHPNEAESLKATFSRDRRIKVVAGDGYQGSVALMPPPQRRGLVLIDPSYEIKSDYQQVVETLQKLHSRFATGVFALWYPVVERQRIDRLEKALCSSGIQRINLYELSIKPDHSDYGMTGSGMIIINPPWGLQQDMPQALPYLARQLGEAAGSHYRIESLVGE